MFTRRIPALDRTGLRGRAFMLRPHQSSAPFADIRADNSALRPRAGNLQDNYRAGYLGGACV